ncbi:MAG: penicillin acylase family protein [Myxococcales bacterium]|jgi:penicillin amidase
MRRSALLALALGLTALFHAACPACSYLSYRLWPDYPPDKSATIDLPGIERPVKVYLDSLGIPHIEAHSEADLLRAVGFVHGRDRFFEMDLMRRIAQGRVSELVGEQPFLGDTTVDFDLAMLGWGLGEAARADAERVAAPMRALLQAYADGVNAALERYEPIEYRLLGVEPEPWRVEDTFALGRLNAWSISANWRAETSRLLFALHGGVDRALAIYPNEPTVGAATLGPETEPQPLPPAFAPELREVLPSRGSISEQPLGEAREATTLSAFAFSAGASNSWAIGGARTRSGKPMTANDPHLLLMAPAMFYQMHLKAPGLDVIGYTTPGLPYVIAGHNRHVSWGTTAAVADVVDLYVEKVDSCRALGPEGWYPLEAREVIVRVRDGKPRERRFTIRRTRHGPLLNDFQPKLLPKGAPAVAVRWAFTDASASFDALSRANRARTVGELRAALAGLPGPIDAWTAADTEGSIALFVNGQVPRRRHLGTFPAPGWLAEYDWDGMVPPEEMPFAQEGADGLLAHANNSLRDPRRARVLLGADAGPRFRYERIRQLLEENGAHDADSFARIQTDTLSRHGGRGASIVAADLASLDAGPIQAKARDILARWDGECAESSAGAVIYFVTWRNLAVAALEDELDDRGLEFVLSDPFLVARLDAWLEDPEQPVWDDRRTATVERRGDVARAAFREAVASLAKEQGPSPETWRWGRVHVRQIAHPLGAVESLASLVNLPQEPASGAVDSVWKSQFDLGNAKSPFRPMGGPVVRLIVDLADLDDARWVLSTGASGWPGSPHYADQHRLWAKGQFAKMLFAWDEIRREARAVITLR